MTKSMQFKVNGHWYGIIKNMDTKKYRFTCDYKDTDEGSFRAAYNTHKKLGNA